MSDTVSKKKKKKSDGVSFAKHTCMCNGPKNKILELTDPLKPMMDSQFNNLNIAMLFFRIKGICYGYELLQDRPIFS